MITVAEMEKLAALETEEHLGSRAKRGSRPKYLRAVRKISDRKLERQDQFKASQQIVGVDREAAGRGQSLLGRKA
jgi:hypothetical protein